MPNKPDGNNDGLLELLKKLWLPVAWFIGFITLAYNFYELWLGGEKAFVYIACMLGLLILLVALGWVSFSKKTEIFPGSTPMASPRTKRLPRYSSKQRWMASILLTLVIITISIAGIQVSRNRQSLQDKFIVLITAFEGPETVYGLHNEIVENISAVFSDDEQIKIITVDNVIPLTEGSEYAQKLGRRYQADIVIWGWYRPTENPNVTFHVENLLTDEIGFQKSLTVQPIASISELRSFTFQHQIGKEISAVISFMAGYIEYVAGRNDSAYNHFDGAIKSIQGENLVVPSIFYTCRGSANLSGGKLDQAIQDFNIAIQLDPNDAVSYNNRGMANRLLGNFDLAIQDYNKAIEINPESFEAYNNRAVAYGTIGQSNEAMRDLDKVIQINPQLWFAYYNRALIYDNQKEFERAIQDLDKAIKLCPTCKQAWGSRGMTYYFLGRFKRAIQDFNKATNIDPKYAYAYYGRGGVYYKLGKYNQAEVELNKAIQIDPNRATSYLGRGYVYLKMGRINDAQADFTKYEEITGQKAP
jgi:tetratricopeptide (TPR) repeat protein